MIPYASRHGRRYRMRRFVPAAGGPRFAQTRYLRLMAVAARLRPLPPMVGERPWALPPRMVGRL